MTQADLQQLLAQGFQFHQAGRLAQAEQCYRQLLATDPNQPNALHLLGVVALQAGRPAEAVDLIGRAVALRPAVAEFHCNLGLAQQSAGRPAEAAASFRTAVALKPDFATAHNNLGNVLKSTGQLDEAKSCFQRALAAKPDYPEAHNNLANLLQAQGSLDDAIAAYERSLQYRPGDAVTLNNLGAALRLRGRLDEAARHLRSAVQIKPDLAEAHNSLGTTLRDQGHRDAALESFQTAVRLKPALVEAHVNLGIILKDAGRTAAAHAALARALELDPRHGGAHAGMGTLLQSQGEWDAAIRAFERALAINPADVSALNNLANTLRLQGRLPEAEAAYRRALQLQPAFAQTQANLASFLYDMGRLDEAVDASRAALHLDPDLAAAHLNLANALKDRGELDAALAACRTGLALAPDDPAAHSNLIYMLHFHPGFDARAIFHESRLWYERHAQPLAHLRPHPNDRNPNRPLRIGYVSPDFRSHPLAHNFLPLALSHDHANFRIFCYSATTRPDAMTQRLRALADEWRSTAGMPPDARADLIRQDQIDILVDLTMHMAYNNLLLLARKPAPIQVAMLCSMGTTGLPTVDYRISDRYSDPPAFNDAFYTEKTIRLPDCYFCHEPPTDTPEVAPPPSRHTGHITYGSLNTFCKVNPHVLDLWARILLHTPRSRLLLRCPAGEPQSRVARTFAARGIAPERIEFSPPRLSLQDYLRLHHRMDIYLDPFPYASHTTGFDALWMGVPIITLAGTRDVGRAGVFLLSNVGLEDLIAQSPEEYLQKAAALAADPAHLASLRETLRPRIRQSPLVDIARYTRHVEAAFRQMWHTWCQQKP